MNPAIEQAIAAAQALGPDVIGTDVFLHKGHISVRIQVRSVHRVFELGAELGCRTPTWCRHEQREWLEAESGDPMGDRSIVVTGGHRDVQAIKAEVAS